jgi:hypothetical protein
MKKIFVLLLLLAMVITMSACGKGKTPDDSTNDIPKYETAAIAGWKDYMIICPDGAEPTISDAFVKLSDAIKAKYGSGLRVGTDFKLPIEEAPTDTLEILIGQTNRNESIAANEGLKYNDYVIKFENNRLIITGGSSTKTAEAVDFYIENFLSDEGLLYPTNEGIAVKGNYKVDKLTIGGVDISNFVIVRGTGMNSSERVLASFTNRLYERIVVECQFSTLGAERQIETVFAFIALNLDNCFRAFARHIQLEMVILAVAYTGVCRVLCLGVLVHLAYFACCQQTL